MRLSIDLNYIPEENKVIKLGFINHIILLIKSGIASVALFENTELMDHKVFRAYMVRKKQGKSQVKYLKTKGKSRAGSRVRLQETLDFFEDINTRLISYFEEYRVDLIAMNSSKILLPYLFESKSKTPFEKKDIRLYKIPKHIASATHENLLEVNEQLFSSAAFITEMGTDIFTNIISINEDLDDDGKEEDW
ncbi:hypothetical protein [Aquiflexum lacus]|uniref:hypothetical protein n=1 Tax=Aquiflexum lacus TaxID=2483805 RepID=UPI001E5A1226|nr:hypothetical protein [Aquiflexum lacus]